MRTAILTTGTSVIQGKPADLPRFDKWHQAQFPGETVSYAQQRLDAYTACRACVAKVAKTVAREQTTLRPEVGRTAGQTANSAMWSETLRGVGRTVNP